MCSRRGPGTLLAIALLASAPARTEDGYDLWLRYEPPDGSLRPDVLVEVARPSTRSSTTCRSHTRTFPGTELS